jgi:predicted metal-binding membrane protein
LRARPAWGVEVLVALAWVALIATCAPALAAHAGTVDEANVWWCMPGMSAPATGAGGGAGLGPAIAMWALMSTAMMIPAAIPAARHVARNSLRRRRRRATTGYLLVYLGIWNLYGVALIATLTLTGLAPGAPPLAPALALLLAAAWQLTPLKRRALRACHRSSPLPPRGSRAILGVIRFSARNAAACLGSCWAMMLIMLTAGARQLLSAALITVLISAEKLLQRPRRATRSIALALGAAGGGVLLALAAAP